MTGSKPDERIRTPMRWDADRARCGVHDRRRRGSRSSDDPRRDRCRDPGRRTPIAALDLPRPDRVADGPSGAARGRRPGPTRSRAVASSLPADAADANGRSSSRTWPTSRSPGRAVARRRAAVRYRWRARCSGRAEPSASPPVTASGGSRATADRGLAPREALVIELGARERRPPPAADRERGEAERPRAPGARRARGRDPHRRRLRQLCPAPRRAGHAAGRDRLLLVVTIGADAARSSSASVRYGRTVAVDINFAAVLGFLDLPQPRAAACCCSRVVAS